MAGLTAAAPAAPADPADAVRTVSYHGYRVQVPADWRVVDLEQHPTACIRFDTPAVYLGTAGAEPDCPAGLKGRTEGLHIEPLTRMTSATARELKDAKSRNSEIRLAVEDAGVLVTAAHTTATERHVRQVLGTARISDDAKPKKAIPSAPLATPQAVGPQPGDFTGKGFDACTAPSQGAMDAWLAGSPYRAVGVYISGGWRACAQPNLTASWVSNQTAKGWRLIPLDVGLQAPCTSFSSRMSSDPGTARSQGANAANGSISAAQSLGIPAGSALYSDIEGYASNASCKAAVLSYLSGWTEALHAGGYLSGVYSSASSGIRDAASEYDNPAYTRVDHIHFAWWNGAADTNTGSYVPANMWANHQRIHQYMGEVTETYGGVSINIDRNYLDVGAGSPPTPSKYWVDTFADAPVFASPTSTSQTGTLYKATNYVYCKAWGREIRDGAGNYNHWWLKTDPDVGPANQYVSAYYLSRWG
ncbi:DUF1906 domain-containing protein, partial [Streptomyces sp. A7024]